MPGPSRWVWVAFATLVGALQGTLFAATGSLVGPLLAHAIINAVNLAYLRDFDPPARSTDRSARFGASDAQAPSPNHVLAGAARGDHGNG
jgi:hypothetical protein